MFLGVGFCYDLDSLNLVRLNVPQVELKFINVSKNFVLGKSGEVTPPPSATVPEQISAVKQYKIILP